MAITVIIPCYKQEQYLEECLDSVFKNLWVQEAIVINDHSPDFHTEFTNKILLKYEKVQIFKLPHNTGSPCLPRNIGCAFAKTDWILCLDADDKIRSDYLSRAMEAFQTDSKIDFVYGDQQNFGTNDGFHPHPEYYTHSEYLKCFNFIPNCVVFKKKCFLETGGFNSDMQGYEDWDFWLNLQKHGFKGHKINSVWYYRQHGDNMYNKVKANDIKLKCQIILNHHTLYTPAQIDWAAEVLKTDNYILENNRIGVIPEIHYGN